MRCKKHLTDLSSGVGVCASCLRERLFVLIQAQAQLDLLDRRKPDPQPPPLVFPRSVSPCISHRKSDNSAPWKPRYRSLSEQLFYSTPQIGPGGALVRNSDNKKKTKNRFSLFSGLFRSKPRNTDSEDPAVSGSDARNSYAASSSSPSWFSGMLAVHRKKPSRMASVVESAGVFGRRIGRNRDRGMSPARVSDCGGKEEDCHDVLSGYSSESSQGWRQTPQRQVPPVRRGGSRPTHSRNVSGLTFCLSPLVRASPNRHWSQKGMPAEVAFSGEIRAPVKPHLSTAASSCANRSRKLADFGRSKHNR
ncbi:uncharacterized protein LOC127801198 [Diospyros lotus]|uniref:uncharacterized protein LOC127801198 n=1 Tax=Diospyros lotus TaxID=55363 RepID=UPI0022597E40|nr:uncharacterized protein LOC127801198 [Diospyros lotus]